MGTPSSKNLYLGAGQVFFDRFDKSGNLTGLRHFGNVPKFDLNTEVDKVEKKSSMSAARETYDETIKQTKATAALTLEEFDPSNVALGLYGEEGTITQEAGTVTDQRFVAYKGKYIYVKDYKISAVTIRPVTPTAAAVNPAVAVGTITSDGTVTSGGTYSGTTADDYYITITVAPTTPGSITGCKFKWKKGLSGVLSADVTASGTGSTIDSGIQVTFALTGSQTFAVGDTWKIPVIPALTEFTVDVDFKVDDVLARGGLIAIPENSRIADKAEVLVGYTKEAGTFPKIAGGNAGSIQGYLLFLGDPSKGPAYNAEFWKVSVTPSGALPFIGDDYGGFDINVTVLSDREHHPDEPMYRAVKLS